MTFDQLLADHPNLKGAAYFALKSWGYSADDAHHEALIVLWDAFRVGSLPENVCSWIITVLRRNEIDKWRKPESRAARSAGDFELDTLEARDDQELETEQGFRARLSRLSPDRADLMVDVHYYQLELEEVADKYGLPIGTVKSRLNRAAERLRILGGWQRQR